MFLLNSILNSVKNRSYLLVALFLINISFGSIACDTTPTITASNVTSVGGGFFTIDVQVCIGTDGSNDGYDLSMNCGLNITATSAPTQNNGGAIATASITGGVLNYFYPGPGDFEPDDGISGPCFSQTITVDGDPLGCTVTATGLNDGCLLIVSEWSATIPGPCFADFTQVGAGSVSGNTTGAGNNCTLRASQDQIIQINVPCDDTWTFSLCGNATWDTYLYLSNSCCGPSISLNDDACGLQSQISTFLSSGTYFITVEAFGSGSSGAYTLDVSSGSPCSVLPIGLIDFSGDFDEVSRSNLLTWTTSSESNNDFFLIERSTDGTNYQPIADIDGAGNSSIENRYTYYDPVASAGVFYYRLKQVDFDGSFTYSHSISIESKIDTDSFFGSIFPNPAKTAFTLITSARNQAIPVSLSFYNNQLQLIKTEELAGSKNASNYKIDVSDLKAGVYTVHLRSGEKAEVRKVVIF